MPNPFYYPEIVTLYDSSGNIQNLTSYTKFTKEIILQLRADVNLLGRQIGITGANWTSSEYNWEYGTETTLPDEPNRLSYIENLRDACEDLYAAQGLGTPTWTIDPIFSLYQYGETATVSGNVISQPGLDTSDIQINDYVSINSGTGITKGNYKITAKGVGNLTLLTAPGDSSAGDVVFSVFERDNKATHTTFIKKSLYTDIRTALIAIRDSLYIFIDSVGGDDITGDGSEGNPYQTWNKAVEVLNASGGTAYFKPGTYWMDDKLTANNVIIQGESQSNVIFKGNIIDNPLRWYFDNADNVEVRNIKFFGDAIGSPESDTWHVFKDCNNLLVRNCIITSQGNVARNLELEGCANATLRHCSFIGRLIGSSQSIGLEMDSNTDIIDCYFYDFSTCYRTNGSITINETNCGFFEYTNITTSSGTPVINITNRLTSDPLIADKNTSYIDLNSPYIGTGSDNRDRGSYEAGPYNLYQIASENIFLSESNIPYARITASDDINFSEDLAEVNMNITINMFLPGLFKSFENGTVEYITKNMESVHAIVPPGTVYTYNGASFDISFSESPGQTHELYIAVDDGMTNYNDVAWWETNAYQGGDAGRNYASQSGEQYFVDAWKDVNGNEFGSGYLFSTVTADGVNNQRADISLKLRIKNINSGYWSELINISKTYWFNDFNKTMYYCADNPRTVDGEYGNHSNYYANQYHTGTNKYTRPDGVSWKFDNRRFVYTPAFKISSLLPESEWDTTQSPTDFKFYEVWKSRKAGTLQPLQLNFIRSEMMIFTCVFVNFGNWNYNSEHCFDNSNPTVLSQAHDNAVGTITNPAMGNNPTDNHYYKFQSYAGSDCADHSSIQSNIIRYPSDGNIAWGGFQGAHVSVPDENIYFQQGETPWISCQPNNRYYLWVLEYVGGTPGGYTAWSQTNQIPWVNTDGDGNYEYGKLSFQKRHDSTGTGTLITLF